MLKKVADTLLTSAVRKGTGATPAGPVTTALITTGASLVLTRGRRQVGLALLVAGGLLLWRDIGKEQAGLRPKRVREKAAPDAAAATGSR